MKRDSLVGMGILWWDKRSLVGKEILRWYRGFFGGKGESLEGKGILR